MKTEKTLNPNSLKQRGVRYWLSRLALLLGLTLLFYFGYCWGIWGRNSLLLQYLFQCGCPLASEEARYPEYVDVIVPACKHRGSLLSPSGRLLHFRTKELWKSSSYLLDLQTMENIDVTDQPFSTFLTDDLWFAESAYAGTLDTIFDRRTGKEYPIQKFRYWREDSYANGEPNLELLVAALRQAEQIYFTQTSNDTVVVLMPNFLAKPDQNFIFSRSDIRGGEFNTRVEQFLQENNIVYETIPERIPYPNERISPDGRFIARLDGIYLVGTGQKIVEGYVVRGFYHPYSGKYFGVMGWTYDGTGVVYAKFISPCLIETNFFIYEETGCFIEVSQPVLKLNVPEEYLIP